MPSTKPTTPRTPGARIRAARERAGLSQVELGARLGQPQSYISAVELGRCGVSLERLYEVAQAIGCDAADLDARFKR